MEAVGDGDQHRDPVVLDWEDWGDHHEMIYH